MISDKPTRNIDKVLRHEFSRCSSRFENRVVIALYNLVSNFIILVRLMFYKVFQICLKTYDK